ncbi:MAG: 50S ribosomal protein L9 [Candidatus Lloydbacteria bacterium]|nr:50S ribosomal protein L9 [Candidatus Lloydbacteria bacterium]
MRVILLKDVPKVGHKYEVKEVAEGFANHFLFPKKLAVTATPKVIASFEKERAKGKQVSDARIAELESYLKKLGDITITMQAKANKSGHLFASLHKKDIAGALTEQTGMPVDEAFLALDEPIKAIGEHDITVQVNDKSGAFKLVVEAEK